MADQPLSSPIRFNCTNCGKPVEVPAQQVGREVGCPHCRAALLVPEPTGESVAPSVQTQTVEGVGAVVAQPAPSPVSPPQTQSVAGEARTEAVEAPQAARTPQTVVEAPTIRMPATMQLTPDEAAGLRSPRRKYVEAPSKKSGTKVVVLAIALLVVIAIGIAVGLSVKRNMERAEKQQALWTEAQQAQTAFLEGELDTAGQHAATVMIREKELKDLGGELEPAQQKQTVATLQQIADYQDRMKELKGLEGRLEANLDVVRQQLRDRRALFNGKGAQARPLILLIEQLIARAEDLAKQRKRDEFQK
jgi:DNA-directed RNA polymerase subunit RPC12/RpoP